MIDGELCREFLRDAFHEGALDLGRERKFLEGFVRIFAGELEALIAVQFATYLEPEELEKLFLLAKPSSEGARQFQVWQRRAVTGRR